MSAHSPGPWKIGQESTDEGWYIITAGGGRVMANVYIEDGNRCDEANARLIASAPDLLSSCERLLAILAPFTALCVQNAGDIATARAVVAKAKGEA